MIYDLTAAIEEYRNCHGFIPDLNHPQRFSEKIFRRKLYDRNPDIPKWIDKAQAKLFARLMKIKVIPTLKVYEEGDTVDFKQFTAPYIIKATHSSRCNLLITKDYNHRDAMLQLTGFLNDKHADRFGEWGYSEIKPRLMAEAYLGDLIDYKFHTFRGETMAIQVVAGYAHERTMVFRDADWNVLPFSYNICGKHKVEYPPEKTKIGTKPRMLQEMLRIAKRLGKPFDYVRVDLYHTPMGVLFGELTFYPAAGHLKFVPDEWDFKFGEYWK